MEFERSGPFLAETESLGEEELSEEEEFEQEEEESDDSDESGLDWGYDRDELIFDLETLRFKPFTTAVTKEEKYGDAIALTGNLYVRQFMEHLPEGIWKTRYYQKPFNEHCVQAQFLQGVTSIQITDVDVNYDMIYHIVENEHFFGNITDIMFRNCNIMDEQVKVLCPRLGNAYMLSNLDLSHNPVGDEGLIEIVTNLPHCASLRTLNLFDTQITPFGLEKFGNVYAKQPINLVKLNIGRNQLNNPISIKKFFAGIVKRAAPLEDLLMPNCTLGGTEIASHFETILSSSESLKYIDISFNLFNTEEELLPIMNLFATSTNISELVLNFNPLTDSVLTTMVGSLFEHSKFEPHKTLYLENMTLPQGYFKDKWNSFNRPDLRIVSAGVRQIKIPKTDSFKYKLVKRLNFLYRKKKSKKDMVVHILMENLPARNLRRVKADDFKDALMLIGKSVDFLLVQEIVNEFSGGGSRANAKEFIDIYNELFPQKPKTPKKSPVDKKKKKSVTTGATTTPAARTSQQQRTSTPAEQRTSTPAEQRTSTPAEQRTSTPAEQRTSTPVEQNTSTPTE